MAFKKYYIEKVIPELQREFDYTNPMAVPKVTGVVLNVGLSKGLKDAKFLETVERTLTRISGQLPVKTKARKSIAAFHIREGMVVGMKVTLRGKRMWDFLEKLVKISIPRVRDFRGLSPSTFDSQGNYALGFREHLAFPEIRADEIEVLHGLQVVVATSAGSKAEGLALMKGLGFPFKEKEGKK